MENNDLQTESMARFSGVCNALHLYFEALRKEGLLPLLRQNQNAVSEALFELSVVATHERVKRSGPNRRPAVFDPNLMKGNCNGC